MASVDQRYLDIGSLKIDEELDTPNKVRLSYYFCSHRTLQYLLGLLLLLFYSFKFRDNTSTESYRDDLWCNSSWCDTLVISVYKQEGRNDRQ